MHRTQWKKRSEKTQTLRAGCSKAEPKNFAQPQTPFPGARDGQNLISWRWSLPSPTNPVWWGSMHAIRVIVVTDPPHTHTQTHTPTNRQDRLQYTARVCATASAQCNKKTTSKFMAMQRDRRQSYLRQFPFSHSGCPKSTSCQLVALITTSLTFCVFVTDSRD